MHALGVAQRDRNGRPRRIAERLGTRRDQSANRLGLGQVEAQQIPRVSFVSHGDMLTRAIGKRTLTVRLHLPIW